MGRVWINKISPESSYEKADYQLVIKSNIALSTNLPLSSKKPQLDTKYFRVACKHCSRSRKLWQVSLDRVGAELSLGAGELY